MLTNAYLSLADCTTGVGNTAILYRAIRASHSEDDERERWAGPRVIKEAKQLVTVNTGEARKLAL